MDNRNVLEYIMRELMNQGSDDVLHDQDTEPNFQRKRPDNFEAVIQDI